MVAAIERAGSADPTAIRDALEATDGLVGTTGIYTFSADDHLGLDLSAFRMLEIQRWRLDARSSNETSIRGCTAVAARPLNATRMEPRRSWTSYCSSSSPG